MSSKGKGSRAELKVLHLLEAEGYVVSKAGASLGMFDLIAIGPDSVRCIQVKYGTSRLSVQERKELEELVVHPCVSKEYWLLKKRKPIEIKVWTGEGWTSKPPPTGH